MERVDLGPCEGRLHAGDPDRVAVLLPGRHYVPQAPLLWFARSAAQRRGWSVLEVWYEEWEDMADWVGWTEERARAGLARTEGARRVVVGKSLASAAAGAVADEGVPAVWLTPLLAEPEIAAGLRRAAAPTLVVGGTADALWDGEVARTLDAVKVLELDGADHSLEIPGDAAASARLLGEVAETIDGFLAAAA